MTPPEPSPVPDGPPRTGLERLLREPLVHFLLLGGLLFAVGAWRGEKAPTAPDRIVISRVDLERRAQTWERVTGRPPTEEERASFVEQAIDDEVAYREAIALGLDQGDTIIRERLREKLEFLTQDVVPDAKATEADLVAFLAANADRYRTPPLVSFDHVFVDRDRRAEGAEVEVKRLLALLEDPASGVDLKTLGDRLPVSRTFDLVPEGDADRDFGATFLEALRRAPMNAWTGPVDSIYGWHLVRVRERRVGEVPDLAEIRSTVEVDWLEAKREAANAEANRRLRAKYRITVEGPEGSEGGR